MSASGAEVSLAEEVEPSLERDASAGPLLPLPSLFDSDEQALTANIKASIRPKARLVGCVGWLTSRCVGLAPLSVSIHYHFFFPLVNAW